MLLAISSIARFVLSPASAGLGGFSTLTELTLAYGKYLQQGFSSAIPGMSIRYSRRAVQVFVFDCLDGLLE
jgi:hypothetical protein